MKIVSNIIIGIAFIIVWVWVFVGTNNFSTEVGSDMQCFGVITLILSVPSALFLILYNNRD